MRTYNGGEDGMIGPTKEDLEWALRWVEGGPLGQRHHNRCIVNVAHEKDVVCNGLSRAILYAAYRSLSVRLEAAEKVVEAARLIYPVSGTVIGDAVAAFDAMKKETPGAKG